MNQEPDSDVLLNLDLVRRRFLRVAFAGSHGAGDDDLGAGLIYYSLTRLNRAQVCVCVGSGGGFVPGLMAQAQHDMGLAPSVTYLVDAVLPELAFGSPMQSGGWLANGHDLFQHFSNLRILRMLSVDAAKLFARQGLTIDYVHIDGDHSRRGVLDDLESFSPLMTPGGVMTLHDTSKKPVDSAIAEFLAHRPTFERLTFNEVGAGTSILRAPLRRPAGTTESPRTRVIDLDEVATRAGESEAELRVRFERWRYLATSAYRMRYSLAATWLDRDAATIVEIGGFPNSVLPHLRCARRVVAVEPYAPDVYRLEIEAQGAASGVDFTLVRGTLMDGRYALSQIGPYSLIALGLDLSDGAESAESFEECVQSLYEALAGAERFVVEWPTVVRTGQLWSHIETWLGCRIQSRVTLDLSADPVAVDFHVLDGRAKRQLILGERGTPKPLSEVASALRVAAAEVYASNHKPDRPADPILPLASKVKFVKGEDSIKYLGFGWSRLEGAFTLALGGESDIVFSWNEADAALVEAETEPLVLSITLLPVARPDGIDGRKIEVWLGERRLYADLLKARQTLVFRTPAASLAGRGPHVLRLIHRDRVRPCDVRVGSTDVRPLSIALVDLAIEPAARPQAGA